MGNEEERRHCKRYRLRLSIRLLRGDVELAAEAFNVSVSGCLLVTPMRLRTGEALDVNIPRLGERLLRLEVVRSRQVSCWYVAAVRFEPHLPEEGVLARLASEQAGPALTPERLL